MAWTTFIEPNVTNITAMLTYVNDTTNNKFGIVLPIMIFVVSYVATSNYPTKKGILVSTFVTFILSALLRMIGIVPDSVVIILVIGLFAGIVFFKKE